MTKYETELIEYLKMMLAFRQTWPTPAGLVYRGVEDYLLQHGAVCDLTGAIVAPGKKKQCFWNARRAAKRNGWTYYEGYAVSIIPMLHGWCVDQEGRVREVTWDELGAAYFGVWVPIEWPSPKAPYLDDWQAGWPAFKTRRPDATRLLEVSADHEVPQERPVR